MATVGLVDCIARGEAVFLRVEDLQPVQLRWENGLLATTEQLLPAPGVQAVPKPDEMLHVELRHVTAAVRGGLCRLTSASSAPFQLTVQFTCSDSILLAAPGVPLIEQDGTSAADNPRQRFIWAGDHNYYEDVDTFWTVRNGDFETPPDVMNFEAWKRYWEPSRKTSRAPSG